MHCNRLLAGLALLLSMTAGAQEQINGLRMWPAPDHTRLVFDLSGPVKHTLFALENPERIVVDLKDAKLGLSIAEQDYASKLLKGVRAGVREGDDLRVVLDLKGKVRPKSFLLRPSEGYGHRLVIDLEDTAQEKAPVRSASSQTAREVVVAIDAGHGGDDPGALGPTGTREKDVVLAIARKLRDQINKEPGMRAVMVRDGDYFLGLKKRVEVARRHRADLFVSIHADAFRDGRARGSSVYVLSHSGSTSEHARLLAEKENASDLVGGVSLDDKDDLLASVLLDLSQTATSEASYGIASEVLNRIGKVNRLHKRKVERAGFRVLKAPDIPSMLVETAFISNPREERALRDPRHQHALAGAIMEGVRAYFHSNPPPGTILANRGRKHVISQGDTLSGIARQYNVSLDSLRHVNGLADTTLNIGQVLEIPGVSDG